MEHPVSYLQSTFYSTMTTLFLRNKLTIIPFVIILNSLYQSINLSIYLPNKSAIFVYLIVKLWTETFQLYLQRFSVAE